MTPQRKEIYDFVKAHPGCQMIQIVRAFPLESEYTVKTRVYKMVQSKQLETQGHSVGTTYQAAKLDHNEWQLPPEYMKVRSIFRVGERYAAQVTA